MRNETPCDDDAGLVATDWQVSFGDPADLGVGYRILGAFPVATLVVDDDTLIEIPDVAGELADFATEAELTIHGETSTVDVVGEGQWGDGVVEIVGTIDTALSDFGISRPDLVGRTARDEVIVEFKLRFIPR